MLRINNNGERKPNGMTFPIEEMEVVAVHDMAEDHFLGIKAFLFGACLPSWAAGSCSAGSCWAKTGADKTTKKTLKTATNKDLKLLTAIRFLNLAQR